jgi:hypothetical protein
MLYEAMRNYNNWTSWYVEIPRRDWAKAGYSSMPLRLHLDCMRDVWPRDWGPRGVVVVHAGLGSVEKT